MSLYLDTTALVKLYVREAASDAVRRYIYIYIYVRVYLTTTTQR